MGASILITTEEIRRDIALEIIPSATLLDNGTVKGIKNNHKLRTPKQEIAYNPQSDIFTISGANTRGDLLDLYCQEKNISRADGVVEFCSEYDLDIDTFNQKKELMDFVGFVPSMNNENLTYTFHNLSMITEAQAQKYFNQYGVEYKILKKCRVIMYKDGDERRAAFAVFDKSDNIVGFKAINLVGKPNVKHIGNTKLPTYLYPNHTLFDHEGLILITIGEINTLCALSQGIDATGIIGWDDKDVIALLEKFRGLEVVLALPADKYHQEDAIWLADALHKIAREVSIIKWPEEMGMPEDRGKTLRHYFMEYGGTVETLNELLVPFRSGEPLPLRRELVKPSDYPRDVLPDVLRDAITDVCNAMQCPPALVAQSFIAVSALAVQAHVNVVIDGRKSPVSNFLVTIADSGERKSSIDKIAMAPVIKREEELRKITSKEMNDYRINVAIWKKRELDAIKGNDPHKALAELGPPPPHPLDATLTCEEPTYEGLVVKMVHGQPSVGIFSDEGGRILGGVAMSRDNQQKTVTGLSTLWDGREITRTRVKDGNLTLSGRRLSMHLMVQPAIAEQLLNNPLFIDQGIMSRILFAYPPSNIGNRAYKEVDLNKSFALKHYNQVIGSILSEELPIKQGTTNELVPSDMILDDDAKSAWVAFHNQVEADMKPDGQYFGIRGFAAKAAEHAARLACIFTCINDPHAEEIPEEWVKSAIRVIGYHLSETLRLFNVSQDSPDLKLAQASLEWLRVHCPTFSLVELYQYGPNQVRNRPTAARIVKILEDHGWVVKIEGGAIIKYNRRKIAWRVVVVEGSK